MDYIFRWLEIRFVSGQQFPLFKDMVQAPAALGGAISTQPLAIEDRVAQPPSAVGESGMGYTSAPAGAIAPEPQQPNTNYQVPSIPDRGIYHASDAMKDLVDMGDAPSCHVCGAIMTRNGSCYRCMSCGSTSGCS
jgi:ribonucleoside-diphosphate reductase alpha chain